MIEDLHVASEFHRNLGGRKIVDGPWSGELFREEHLRPALKRAIAKGIKLRVDFDGTSGMPTSFTQEAFAGLMKGDEPFTPAQMRRYVEIVSPQTPRHWPYVQLALQYIDEEAKRQGG